MRSLRHRTLERYSTGPRLTAMQQRVYQFFVVCAYEGIEPATHRVMWELEISSAEAMEDLLKQLERKKLLKKKGSEYRLAEVPRFARKGRH
jgi:hypothetical protein